MDSDEAKAHLEALEKAEKDKHEVSKCIVKEANKPTN